MARARNIKPGFFKNEDLAECSAWARLCFAGLWTLADREGRLEDRPKRIKGELFAYDSVEVDPLLCELEHRGFVLRYTVLGVDYIQILAFLKHQNPHHKEPPSIIPSPESPGSDGHGTTPKPEALPTSNEVKASDNTEASPGLLPQDSTFHEGETGLIPDSGFLIPDSGEEKGKRKRSPSFDAATVLLPPWLDVEVWTLWCLDRRKRGKPITEAAVSLQFAKLDEYRAAGHTPRSVLEHAIASGNQGLFPPPSAGRQFQTAKERDTAAATARVREMTGGLLNGPYPDDVIEMEATHAAQIGSN